MTGRYQKGEDLKEQGPRQGKQQIPLRRERISLKPTVSQKRKARGSNITPSFVIKRKSTARPFPSLPSDLVGTHPHTCTCAHMHTHS